MAADENSLRALETIMTEFFDGRTSNERKRQIEEILNNFSCQQGAWRHCLYFIQHTQNEYVMMYCLTVLEHVINKQWIGMLGEGKGEIRSTLYKFLLAEHKTVPHFIRNKLGKLIVDIGRLDWPHFYPDFFSNILKLTQSNDTSMLGLILLQTASEELAAPREDLSVSRKEELHHLLLEQVPSVLSILSNHLETTLEKHRHLVTATPPPSPTHGQATNSHMSLFNTSTPHTGNLLSSMFKSLSNKNPFHALPPLDAESHQLCVQAINCLTHFLSWIPLSTHITPTLLTTVFHFASFGCDPLPSQFEVLNSDSSINSSHISNKAVLGVMAMGCINEIMSKNCIPNDFEEFLLQIFQNTFYLLQQFTKDNISPTGIIITNRNRLEDLDENYIEKFTDFLRLFVSVHLRRFESNSQFPVLEFLALLFKYTFQQPTHDGFYSCLDIWGIFLDYLTARLKTRQIDQLSIMERYKDALMSLVTQVLQKFQFKYNQSSLEELDDESLDDDSETEWQHFLRQCLEIIAKVADLMPADTYAIIYPVFQENMDIYLGLEQFIHPTSDSSEYELKITAENECRRLHCSLRDLSSILQGIGRLANHFIGEAFCKQSSKAQTVLQRLCQAAEYSNRMKLYDVKTAAPNVLKTDFTEVHAQTLATIKAFCHWLAQLYGESVHKNEEKECFNSFIRIIIEATIPVILHKAPEKVAHSSSHLLISITYTVRPSFLFGLSTVQQLFSAVCNGEFFELPVETQMVIYRSISNILLLPWPGISDSEQDWMSRSSHHQQFIQALTRPLKRVNETPGFNENKELQDQGKQAIKWTVRVLKDLVDNLTDATTRSKQVCYQTLHDVVHSVVSIFPVYLSQPDISEDILNFFLSLFLVLRSQMGLPFAEQTIQTFLGLFTRNQIQDCILYEGSAGCHVVEKFLELLQQIVQEPGSGFKTFIPNTIILCMDQIYPLVAERSSPDVKQTLFELLHQILLHNWRYFFKTNVITSLGQAGHETVEHSEHFTKIMQAYGQSFLQPDIGLFRQNLESLENLNSKWKLYQKGLFRMLMLNQFLNVLLQTLIVKTHNLLQEEIGISIYNMASIDFDNFYSNFLPQFLNNCQSLDDNQKTILGQNFKLETDLPSFTQNLHRFVNDLRYYQLCNSFLPAGSVRF